MADGSLALDPATDGDVEAITRLRRLVAVTLTERLGDGPWSWSAPERGVRAQLKKSAIFVVRSGPDLIATLRLTSKRPWAIDPTYFTTVDRPLYLTDMAVDPAWQRRGIGRGCLIAARRAARDLAGEAIRLDAYHARGPGAAPFYRKCGFREVARVSYRSIPLVYFEALGEQ
jgi:GNAT superfamily N-acetyltransferase